MHKILTTLSALWVGLMGLLGINSTQTQQNVGGFSVATGYEKSLRVSMDSTQSYIPVTSLALKDSTTLTMSLLGDEKVFLTIEPGTTREEISMCTTINTSTLNFENCTRGLSFSGTSTVTVSGNRKPHNAGSKVIMSNVHYIYEQFVDTNSKDQTIAGNKIATGTWTFTNSKGLCLYNSNFCIRSNGTNLQWSEDNFANSYNFTSTSITQLTASSSAGIGVLNSQIYVNASSTTGLLFDSSGKLYENINTTTGMMYTRNDDGANSDTISQLVGDTTNSITTSTVWTAQTFYATGARITTATVIAYVASGTSSCYTSLYNTSGGFPTTLIATGTPFTPTTVSTSFSTYFNQPITPNQTYALVNICTVANNTRIVKSTSDVYSNGTYVRSVDSGLNWSTQTGDQYFTVIETGSNSIGINTSTIKSLIATSTPTINTIPIAPTSTTVLADGWQTVSQANATDLTDSGSTTLHYHQNLIYATSTDVSATESDTSNKTLYTFTIPANTLTTSTLLTLEMPYDIAQGGANPYAPTLSVFVSSTLMCSATGQSWNAGSTGGIAKIEIYGNTNNSQQCDISFVNPYNVGGGNTAFYPNYTTSSTPTFNMSLPQSISTTVRWTGSGASTDSWGARGLFVKYFKN